MATPAWWRKKYASLVAERRCTHCRKELAAGDKSECGTCRDERLAYEKIRYQERVEKRDCARCLTRLPADWPKRTCQPCLEYVAGNSRRLYWERKGVPWQRTRKRAASVKPARRKALPSSKWQALAGEMSTRCKHCGLRGPHECIKGDPEARLGPGRVFPSYGWSD